MRKILYSFPPLPRTGILFGSMYKITLLFVFFIMLCATASAYDLYVDAIAHPVSADGTSIHPYETIQRAINHAFDDSLSVNESGPAVRILVYDSASGYLENLQVNYYGNVWPHNVTDITIQSLSNNPENCMIIGPEPSLPVLSVIGNDYSKLSLKGLAIKRIVLPVTDATYGIHVNGSGPNGSFNTLSIDNCDQ